MTTRHNVKHRFAVASSLAVACAAYHPQAATPANYPIKPIRLVVPFAAGGGTDIMANTPAEFAAVIRDDYARWAGVIKVAGVKVE